MQSILKNRRLFAILFAIALCASLCASPGFGQTQLGNRPASQNGGSTATQLQTQRQQSATNNQINNGQNNGQGLNQQPAQQQLSPNAGQPAGTQQIPIVPMEKAVASGLAQVVQQPFPPLSPQKQAELDNVLNYWEKRTSQINTFECKFKRYIFNATSHATHPQSIAEGFIRYKNPDKGVFKEDAHVTLAGNKPDGSPDYKVNPNASNGDWWVCDGEWVHNLDRNDKKAVRTQLPPELRGNNIPLSPLPFLFGVKAQEVKARYFVRLLDPPQGNTDVWIEAWPKRADDAGNYSRVQVALDRNDVLPNAMIMFMPNWSNDAQNREVFNFAQREVNSNTLLDKIKEGIFMKAFIDTKVPSDWDVIQEPWIPPQQVAPPSQAAPNGQPAGGRVAAPGQPPTRLQ